MTDSAEPTIIYPARLVRTMDPANPVAEAVAVRGERVRAVGTTDELLQYPGATVDRRYAEAVLVPGFVEAHSHARTGVVWSDTYVGFLDRTDPDGRQWPGCTTIEQVIERLKEADEALDDPEQPLLAWGFDPIFFDDGSLSAAELDQVSGHRPIHVLHASAHLSAVNSATLELCGVDASASTEGVVKDSQGRPTGELRELAAMALVGRLGGGPGSARTSKHTHLQFAQQGVNTGTTTLTDLGSRIMMDDEGVDSYRNAVDDDFPARLNVFHIHVGRVGASLSEAAERLVQLADSSTGRLRLGNVKLMLDGTIQGFTARLLEPGYLNGQPNGIWNVTPQEYYEAFKAFHKAGLLIHVHCNGDQASQLFVDTLERVLTEHPRADHRHTCTHAQLATPAQYRRMAVLGACANVFSNHIWSWGDKHMDVTVGPDRARRMNAAATALRSGVRISIHSDSPVTPLGPLQTMKHAVTRLAQSGRVMGEHERITAEEALEAATVGGAYMLKMDHEVGSLEAGKFADIAVLGADPLAVAPEEIGNIRVHGTIVGGKHYTSRVAAR